MNNAPHWPTAGKNRSDREARGSAFGCASNMHGARAAATFLVSDAAVALMGQTAYVYAGLPVRA